MVDTRTEFECLVAALLDRFAAQNGRTVDAADRERVARQLGQVVAARGLPRALRVGERGEAGGMSEEVCAPLVARVMAEVTDAWLADPVRQLVKACFYPEFLDCRDSFREVAKDGSCRRQELARARGRISGTHCVDCPHWVSLAPAEHEAMLAREWRGDPTVWAEHREVFLPEDFRALRVWMWTAARRA